MVAEKQRQGGHGTDAETIKGKILQHLVEVCKLLPDGTPIGREFANVMLELQGNPNNEDAVKALVEKAMDERDDLCDYSLLRQELVCKINR